ncbi:hypothetical protein EHW67_00005, partial [Arenibacter aquaticus]
MKIITLYRILSNCLIEKAIKRLVPLMVLMLVGASGYGQATVTFSSATGSGAEDAGSGIPTLLVDGLIVAPSSVTLTPSGTATGGGDDYTLASTTINIPA